MHGSERPSPPPSGPPGTRSVGPGSDSDTLKWAIHTLGTDGRNPAVPDPFASGSDSVPQPGPEFYATYDSECASEGCLFKGVILEDDCIRADGEGGYVHTECWED